MKQIAFNKAGGNITVELKFYGRMVTRYVFQVKKANSNADVLKSGGDNQNQEDDKFQCPGSAADNDGRLLWATYDTSVLDPKDNQYELVMEVYQDGKMLGSVSTNGALAEGIKRDMLYALLKGS